MIEPIMFFGIGFLVASLLGLVLIPLVHDRAVRLTMRRLEAATPLSMAEIQADKDQLRAEFAMSTRRLEMCVEQMKAKTTSQLAELGKKTDAINRLKVELGEKTAAIFALEAREKALQGPVARHRRASTRSRSARCAKPSARSPTSRPSSPSSPPSSTSARSPPTASASRSSRCAPRSRRSRTGSATTRRKPRRSSDRLDRERKDASRRHRGARRRARQGREARRPGRRARARADRADHRGRNPRPPRAGARNAGSPSRCASWPSANIEMRAAARQDRGGAEDRSRSARRDSPARRSPPRRRDREPDRARRRCRGSARPGAGRAHQAAAARSPRMKREAEQTWAAERVENALLRERINDIAAEIARLTVALEGPTRRSRRCWPASRHAIGGARADQRRAQARGGEGKGNLADRIRALQTRRPRGSRPN